LDVSTPLAIGRTAIGGVHSTCIWTVAKEDREVPAYPTLAQEIREMQTADPVSRRVRARVIRVEFDRKDGIPADAREEISAELRSYVFERDPNTAYLDDLANEIAEVGARGALQNRGYFTATTTAKLTVIQSTVMQSDDAEIRVAAIIRARPGPQYRAGNIRIESSDTSSLKFSPDALLGLIPLQRGQLFNVEKIGTGLTNLTLAYGREGYVDMTAEPDFAFDEAHETIDMVFKINQQVQYQYHVGTSNCWA
jgi:Surface antigen variable number repeat